MKVAESSVPGGCVSTRLPGFAHGDTQASWCHTPRWSATVKGNLLLGGMPYLVTDLILAVVLMGCCMSSIQKYYHW